MPARKYPVYADSRGAFGKLLFQIGKHGAPKTPLGAAAGAGRLGGDKGLIV